MHEFRRPCNNQHWTDVYDSPRWHRVMGPATNRLERVGVQVCTDGLQAFDVGGYSVKPVELLILSLPPDVRQRDSNIMLFMLLPQELKTAQTRKYYDWSSKFELNRLHTHGVSGVRMVVYGTSLDSPGRAELLQVQSHSAIYGCPFCYINFDAGISSKPVYGGFRRFLGAEDPWRQRQFEFQGLVFQFADVEVRQTPQKRTTRSALECSELAMRWSRPFRGHKAAPLICRWPSFCWEMHASDIMHDIKCVCDGTLTCLVGRGKHGKYALWTRDQYHRTYCRVHNIFQQVHDETNPLPWRLSGEDVNVLDTRVNSMWWPHYTEIPLKNGFSFWTKTNSFWKASHKKLIWMVL